MRTAILAIALATLSTSAIAQTKVIETECRYITNEHGRVWHCREVHNPSQGGVAKVIKIEPSRNQDRIDQWERACQPRLTAPDHLGVVRYTYSKPGCEHGQF